MGPPGQNPNKTKKIIIVGRLATSKHTHANTHYIDRTTSAGRRPQLNQFQETEIYFGRKFK